MAEGEAWLFRKIWNELEPEERCSFITGYPLEDVHTMHSFYFAHVLSKGSAPEFRLKKENIALLTLKEHRQWDTARHEIRDNPLWIKMFELEKELKAELLKLRSNTQICNC